MIVFGMGKNLIFQSVLGHCGSAWSEPGLSEPGVLGQCQTFTYKVILSHPGGTDYVNHITAGPHGFSDIPTTLCAQRIAKQVRACHEVDDDLNAIITHLRYATS